MVRRDRIGTQADGIRPPAPEAGDRDGADRTPTVLRLLGWGYPVASLAWLAACLSLLAWHGWLSSTPPARSEASAAAHETLAMVSLYLSAGALFQVVLAPFLMVALLRGGRPYR